MNINLIFKRILRRPTLLMGAGSSVAPAAKILNSGGASELIRVGCHTRIEGEIFVFPHGGRLQIGDWCFVGPGTRIWSAGNIFIGNRVLISHNCNIMDSLTHPISPQKRHAQFKSIIEIGHPKHIDLGERPVIIEDDVWVGAGATVLRGVCLGRASIVGAGAVVTRDVPPNTVVAGNPARVIREINAEELR